jgi:hypothetical protein
MITALVNANQDGMDLTVTSDQLFVMLVQMDSHAKMVVKL